MVRWAVRALAAAGIAGCLGLLPVSAARADDDAPEPAPRTAVTIGGASVVLIATADKLYAFVDRTEDNAPVEDAELQVDNADGSTISMAQAPITMSKATAGLFVGPLNRQGHMHDAFLVTLRSSAGSGEAPAEIAYTDVAPPAAAVPVVGNGSKIGIALVSGGIGAIGSVLMMLWLRSGRKRLAPGGVGSAPAV